MKSQKQKWQPFYQTWLPFDEQLNEWMAKQKEIELSKQLKKINKKYGKHYKSWREYLSK